MRRAARDTRRILPVELAGLAVLYAISVGFRVWVLLTRPADFGTMGTWLPAYFDLFAMGMALAVASAWRAHRGVEGSGFFAGPLAPGLSWAVAGLLFWAICTRLGLPRNQFAHPLTTGQWLWRHLFYGLVSFFLLLPAVFGPQRDGLVRRFLQLPVMLWLGLVSYGIYLWHEVFINRWYHWHHRDPFSGHFNAMLLEVALLTVAAAAVSYYIVERPALSLKRRRE